MKNQSRNKALESKKGRKRGHTEYHHYEKGGAGSSELFPVHEKRDLQRHLRHFKSRPGYRVTHLKPKETGMATDTDILAVGRSHASKKTLAQRLEREYERRA